jgi:hypothetical protein
VSTLRFPDAAAWDRIERHVADAPHDRFAFALTRVVADAADGPVLEVRDVELVHDAEVGHDGTGAGWAIAEPVLDRIHGRAAAGGFGLVEVHAHGAGPPHFSYEDEAGLIMTVDHLADLLDDRPYGAGVLAGARAAGSGPAGARAAGSGPAGVLHAEWFRRRHGEIQRGVFRSVTVLGEGLRVLNARWEDERRFQRQVPIVGRAGQATLRRLRVAVIGGGGTGSHAVTQLGYLGVRDLLLLDDDVVDPTSLNRVVTAEPADIGAPKTLVARRRVLALDHHATVRVRPGLTPHGEHPELAEADLLVGCVDDDGPRHRLNELAVDAGVPYLDIGTGVDTDVDPPALGARLAFVLPGGPCLTCTAELDPAQVARWYGHDQPDEPYEPYEPYQPDRSTHPDRFPGRGAGDPRPGAAPSVVHLNGLAVSTALAEAVAWATGARPPALRLDIDVNGNPGFPGTRISPSADRARRPGCPSCSGRRH